MDGSAARCESLALGILLALFENIAGRSGKLHALFAGGGGLIDGFARLRVVILLGLQVRVWHGTA